MKQHAVRVVRSLSNRVRSVPASLGVVSLALILVLGSAATAAADGDGPYVIKLRSREFTPSTRSSSWIDALELLTRGDRERTHILVQTAGIPSEAEKRALADQGLSLLAYVPDHTWIASVPAGDPGLASRLSGVIWAGELMVGDKIDRAIKENLWGSWNRAPDGTVAVYAAFHRDEDLEAQRDLIAALGGRITGTVAGLNLLVVEMPDGMIGSLAAEDAVLWVEPAAPPLEGVNDGSRPLINVDVLQGAPYNLTGGAVDVLVYDSGQVGDHVDFGTRLNHGDADAVSEHSTHVAGTVGGSGANSAAQGGTALEWRGMATGVDLISFGTGYSGSGVIFYENVPDIENDWAQAQNFFGADIGTASLGSNIYDNYPSRCDLMGVYGASSVLIDQIVAGNNSTVGIGDRYIATWAAGNERGWATSCGTYAITAPPAAAKNPIHVGGANTNDSTQYLHTSWGPTADGRLKPTVTAGACQTSGDFGVTSTDNSPVDDYTVMCGTSMATPAVAGGIALMLEHYRDVYGTSGSFWPSTAKAILIQTATDMGNVGPDYQWGFGIVDIQAAVDLITRQAFRQDSISAGSLDEFSFDVSGSGADVLVSLAWDDYEATFLADPTLINDLDLELVAPDGSVWLPWILDPNNPTNAATRGVNTVDNQEQVLVPSASVIAGKWLARVNGTTVPQAPQDYSLACEGCVAGQHASLSVAVGPAASGTVSGTGIACEGDCWEVYDLNDTVVLTAAAGAGFSFDSWTGCDSPAGATCTMTMNGDKTVTANFQQMYSLDVAIAPAGGGSVTGTGIACPGDCNELFDPNTVVVLDAAANPGYSFNSWTGCDSPVGTTCTMVMTTDKLVTANFEQMVQLDVDIDPAGGGGVTGAGIACPGDCTELYQLNTVVVLDAAANAGYEFDSWTGCDSPAGATCTMTMDTNELVTANFRAVATLDVVVSPPLGGNVSGDGISCPTDCSEIVEVGTTLDLTATANDTFEFLEWLGCDVVDDNVCTVTVDENRTVAAVFATKVPTASAPGLAVLAALIALAGAVLVRRFFGR